MLLFFNAGKFTNVDIQWFLGALLPACGACFQAMCGAVC